MKTLTALRLSAAVCFLAICNLSAGCGHAPPRGERGSVQVSSDFYNQGQPAYLSKW